MSYTTQKEFFNVPFRNEEPKLPERKRSDGALMTYDLCTDSRAWALDKQKRSNYILDVVHKARFKKAVLHPEGQFELTKDYLIHLDVDDLAEYILSLQAEIQRKNSSVQQLEETRKSISQQLESVQMKSNELGNIRQQSAMLAEERHDFEQQMEDLEMVIIDLKDRADRYDLLANENALLREQVQHQRKESADRIRMINAEVEANFNRMRAEDYEKLEAELVLFKAQYEDLRQQKRDLKEQLQRALVQQAKATELKRQLALEQADREKVEDELEHLLSLYDQHFNTLDGQPLAAIEDVNRLSPEQWAENRMLSSSDDEAGVFQRESTIRTGSAAAGPAEKCENCGELEQQLDQLQRSKNEELQERANEVQALQEQVNLLQQNLDLAAKGGDEQTAKLMDDVKNYRDELAVLKKSEQEAQLKVADMETTLKQKEAKLAEEARKVETLETAAKQQASPAKDDSKGSEDSKNTEEIDRLQQMLEEAQAELVKKSTELNVMTEDNNRLQAETAVRDEKLKKLQETQQQQLQQLAQLEASKTEQTQGKEQIPATGGAEYDTLKATNAELRNEIDRLTAAQSAAEDDAAKVAESQKELMKTLDSCRLELDNTRTRLEEKERAIKTMEEEAQVMRSRQQSAPESTQQLASAEAAAAVVLETQRLSKRIEELENELEQCEAEKDQLKRVQGDAPADDADQQNHSETLQESGKVVAAADDDQDMDQRKGGDTLREGDQVTDDDDQAMYQREPSDTLQDGGKKTDEDDLDKTAISEKTLEAGEAVSRLLDEAELSTIKQGSTESGDEEIHEDVSQKTVSTVDAEKQRASLKSERSTGKLVTEPGRTAVDETVPEPDRTAVGEGAAKADRAAVGGIESDKQAAAAIHREGAEDHRDSQGFVEGDDLISGVDRDPDETVVEPGTAEDARESASKDAWTRKSAIDEELNAEQKAKPDGFMDVDLIRIGTSDPDKTRLIAIKIVHHGIDVLVIAELDHLHREICRAIIERYLMLGQNVKVIDKAMYECHQILDTVKKMGTNEMNSMLASPATQVPIVNHLLLDDETPVRLPAKSKPRPKSTNLGGPCPSTLKFANRVLFDYDDKFTDATKWTSKKQGKTPPENNDQCRTRPWRAPRTPTETIVASTLADGSRVVVRQKRNL